MARKKKEKIRVNLELPKDDKTQDTFIAILLVGVMMGLLSLGFWITNSDLVFQPVNGNPMFVNLACPDSFDAEDMNGPSYFDNESCFLTHEAPSTESWGETWLRVQSPGDAKIFHVPGMGSTQLIDSDGISHPHPLQPMTVKSSAQANNNYRYFVKIQHIDDGNMTEVISLECYANDDSCSDSIPNAEANGEYQLWVVFVPIENSRTRVVVPQTSSVINVEGSEACRKVVNGQSFGNFSAGDLVYDSRHKVLGTVVSCSDSTIQFSSEVSFTSPTDLYSYSPAGHVLQEVSFSIDVEAYDGIPANMNNNSLWVGPELSLGPLNLRPTLFVNFFGLGLLLMVYPAALYSDRQMAKIEAIEEKFPDFLRDLAEYWKGGLSMTLAVRTLANSEYGSLNNEVKKMSDQLSWGISFSDVLEMFAERVGTPLVKRAVSLVSEANKAGGKISDILVTAANDSREIQFLKGERQRAIGSYIAVIWVSFMVFLGVIVVLSKVFIPAIASSNSGGSDATIGNMQINAVDPLFFLVVFFYGVCAQAMGNGAMAGLMATGRLSTGMKHAGMMLIICIVLFNVAAFDPSLIGVPQPVGLRPDIGSIPMLGLQV
ncbi:MAG: type II secretion system F family protein [Candidatus Thalassarchaeaceae archaeon]|nr:type II secretion system F family protein [Candidatus Thalassarchaeaceae archaeon]